MLTRLWVPAVRFGDPSHQRCGKSVLSIAIRIDRDEQDFG
jgi:hypothetical protein